MSLTKLKLGTLMAILLVACGSVPNFAFGELISSYSEDDQISSLLVTGGNFLIGQITGNKRPDTFTFIATSTSRTFLGAAGGLIACPTSTYVDNCYKWGTPATSTMITAAGLYSISITSTTTFPNGWYAYMNLNAVQDPFATFYLYGSTASVGAPGEYCRTSWTSGGTCAFQDVTIKSAYFLLFSTPNNQSEGIRSIISPTYAQVVSSADNVNFNFSYYINSLTYDKAGFTLVDNTAGQNIAVSSLEEDINASGLSTFSDYFDLIYGHVYSWTPYLRNSTTDAYIYGSTTPFFAGAKTNQSIPEQPTPLWNGCTNILCQGAIFSTSTGILTWNGGTTTTPFGPFGETLDDLLRNKAPFSYLYDLKQLLYELGNGSAANTYSASCANSDAYYTLPSGTLGTTLSNGSTTIKFIDACAIKEMSVVQEIRRAITYALYLITGIGLTGMAMSAI